MKKTEISATTGETFELFVRRLAFNPISHPNAENQQITSRTTGVQNHPNTVHSGGWKRRRRIQCPRCGSSCYKHVGVRGKSEMACTICTWTETTG